MLTDGQVDYLRRAVEASQTRPWVGPFRWAHFEDGPLAGLRCRVRPDVAEGPEASLGWCCPTPDGLVVAMYCQAGEPGRWRLRGWERPGARESGKLRDAEADGHHPPTPTGSLAW